MRARFGCPGREDLRQAQVKAIQCEEERDQ